MAEDPEKQTRPPGQDDPTDPDLSQDPGIPGPKVEEEQELEREQSPGRGFPGTAQDPGGG
jgi:hypothetical protein